MDPAIDGDCRVGYCRADVYDSRWDDMLKTFERTPHTKSIDGYCRVGFEVDADPGVWGEGRWGHFYWGVAQPFESDRADVYTDMFNTILQRMEQI